MRFFIYLFFHVLAEVISTPELYVVETDDGMVYGIDSILGTSVWTIITGPALVESKSFVEGAEFHVTEDGYIYAVDYSTSTSFKLSKTVQEIVYQGPLVLEEMPEVLFYGNKNTKLFRVNAWNGEYSEEALIDDLCPLDSLSYSKSLMLGRIDYSVYGFNESTSEMLVNLTFSSFTSFSSKREPKQPLLESVSVVEDDSLVLTSGKNTIWTKKFTNNIIGLHGYNPENFALDRVELNYSYFSDKALQSSYYEYIAIGLLLLAAMTIGFYFGRNYVIRRQKKIEEIIIRRPTPVHSRNTSLSEKVSEELCVLPREESGGALLEFMKNKAPKMNNLVDGTIIDPRIFTKDYGTEKAMRAEFEYSVVKGDSGMIKTETQKIVTAYELSENENDSVNMIKAMITRQNSKTEYKINTYPSGEFSKVIEILDDGNYNKKFVFEKILGYGGFSEVHLARHKLDDQLYAIKIVKMKVGEKEHLTSHKLFSEVNAIKTLQSKYVVRYITCWVEVQNTDSRLKLREESSIDSSEDFASSELSIKSNENYMTVFLHIQMEYCEGTTLKEWLDASDRTIDRKKNYIFFYQMLKGIQHIHERGIIHRDLKPANIFIDGKDNIKIGDFNLATFLQLSASTTNSSSRHLSLQRRSMNIGTPLYLAPEQETSDYNHKVDIFPLGLILLQFCFKSSTYHELAKLLGRIRKDHTLPDEIMNAFEIESQIILLMTAADPESRPDAVDLLKGDLMERWKREVIST